MVNVAGRFRLPEDNDLFFTIELPSPDTVMKSTKLSRLKSPTAPSIDPLDGGVDCAVFFMAAGVMDNGVEIVATNDRVETDWRPPVITVILESVLPVGAVTGSWVLLAEVTVAGMPPKYTLLLAAVGLKPLPLIVTVVP